MVNTMLAIMAPLQPAQMAVTKVAMMRQQTALAIVRRCDSIICFSNKKAPFGAEV